VLTIIRRSFVLGCIDDVRQFKAFIAYDCLVHPDHPLSIGNEKGGIELYQGTPFYVHIWAFAFIFVQGPFPMAKFV
jgi:hypothetical protein